MLATMKGEPLLGSITPALVAFGSVKDMTTPAESSDELLRLG
tara:strand:+ start:446 stop:571 length:126 start_codon:yes stop_codon:yes gene_type:complete